MRAKRVGRRGCGYIGRALGARAVLAGETVTGVVRTAESARRLERIGIEPIVVELTTAGLFALDTTQAEPSWNELLRPSQPSAPLFPGPSGEWVVEWGEQSEWLQEVAEASGTTPKAIRERPTIDDPSHAGVDVVDRRGQRGRSDLGSTGHALGCPVLECSPAREHLVKHEPQGVQVALDRDVAAFELLRRLLSYLPQNRFSTTPLTTV